MADTQSRKAGWAEVKDGDHPTFRRFVSAGGGRISIHEGASGSKVLSSYALNLSICNNTHITDSRGQRTALKLTGANLPPSGMVLAFENDLERISWATKLIDESSTPANDVPDGLGTSTHGSSMSGGGATSYGGAPQLSRSMGGWDYEMIPDFKKPPLKSDVSKPEGAKPGFPRPEMPLPEMSRPESRHQGSLPSSETITEGEYATMGRPRCHEYSRSPTDRPPLPLRNARRTILHSTSMPDVLVAQMLPLKPTPIRAENATSVRPVLMRQSRSESVIPLFDTTDPCLSDCQSMPSPDQAIPRSLPSVPLGILPKGPESHPLDAGKRYSLRQKRDPMNSSPARVSSPCSEIPPLRRRTSVMTISDPIPLRDASLMRVMSCKVGKVTSSPRSQSHSASSTPPMQHKDMPLSRQWSPSAPIQPPIMNVSDLLNSQINVALLMDPITRHIEHCLAQAKLTLNGAETTMKEVEQHLAAANNDRNAAQVMKNQAVEILFQSTKSEN